jgi:3-oxoacyl-[acyl-carrier protein] reductase
MSNIAFTFTGQTVIITGAARGIGLELARFFADAGGNVIAVDFDGDVLEQACAEVGATGVQADVSNTDDVQRVIDTAMAKFGRIDVLVNNAGILRDGVVWKMSDDDWDAVLNVHAGGTFKFTRACVPHFRARGYGRIINVTSYSGIRGNTGQANYATAKAGIIGFTKTAAKELARFGITVNAISPNAETRMVAGIPTEKLAEIAAGIPMARFAHPSEICSAVGFLGSEEAGYVTGVVLPVDGGISM